MARMHDYTDEQTPCLVAKKACGCYVMALVLEGDTFERTANLFPEQIEEDDYLSFDLEDLRKDSLLDQIITARLYGASLEVKPVSFVRKGGLNFDCKHARQEQTVGG